MNTKTAILLLQQGKQIFQKFKSFFIAIFILIAILISGGLNAPTKVKIQNPEITQIKDVKDIGQLKSIVGVDAIEINSGKKVLLPLVQYTIPTNGIITQRVERSGYAGVGHPAWDIANILGTPIYAVFSGKVTIVKTNKWLNSYNRWSFCSDLGGICYYTANTKADIIVGCGMQLTIQNADGLSAMYCHLSEQDVSVDDKVEIGQVIGKMGTTGWSTAPHLHIEISYNGKQLNPSGLYDIFPWYGNLK